MDAADKWIRNLKHNKEYRDTDREYEDFIKLVVLSVKQDLACLGEELWDIGFALVYFLDGGSHDRSDFNISIETIPEDRLKDCQRKLRSLPLTDHQFDALLWCDP
jgi:hypothetical protein